MEEVVFWGIWAVLGICMLCYYLRRKRKILSMLAGVGSGFLALLLVHYGGGFFGFSPALNLLHLVQACLLYTSPSPRDRG